MMQKKNILRFSAVVLGISSLSLGCFMSAGAEDAGTDLVPGATVYEDADSATGYSVTFVYEDAEAESVTLTGSFLFYKDDYVTRAETPDVSYTPYEWEPGMFVAGDEAYSEAMTKAEGTDYWTLTLPLPSGDYCYVYYVDDSEEKLTDPANPPEIADVENGGVGERSTVYVPYDEEKQKGSTDWSFVAPREDGQSGEITYVNYTDVLDNTASLGVYLPYGYDENREEGYPVLYLSHGAGGNETDWFNTGDANTIFDNLTAEGKVEPTIVVTMNNSVYDDWDMDLICDNTVNYIIPFMEENYNVSKEASGRAFAGLSMGAQVGTCLYYDYADQFGCFGFFSSGVAIYDLSEMDLDFLKLPRLMLGAGNFDNALSGEVFTGPDYKTLALRDRLDTVCIPYTFSIVQGSHDWFTWPQLLKIMIEDCLWK